MMFKTNRLSRSFEPKFCLCGNSIDCVKKIMYLGFVLTSDLKAVNHTANSSDLQ